MLDAAYLLSEAWDDVKQETVANCFRHSKFTKREISNENLDVLGDIVLPENMTMGELMDQIDIDKDVEVAGSYTDEQLVEEVKRKRQKTDFIDHDDDDETEVDIPTAEVLAALRIVRQFSQKNNYSQDIISLRNIERKIVLQKAANSKQTNIDSFFTVTK